MPLILNGNHVALSIKKKIKETIVESGIQPRLSVILIGHHPESMLGTKRKIVRNAELIVLLTHSQKTQVKKS